VSAAVIFANAGVALLRINYNLLGWVPSLLFVPFAARRDGASLLLSTIGCYFVTHYGIDQAGIDVYGPHHYVEVTLPMLVLSAIGLQSFARWLRDRTAATATAGTEAATAWRPELVAPSLAVSLAAFALVGYDPPRVSALRRMARDVNFPRDQLDAMGVHDAVIFSPRPFTAQYARCNDGMAGHFVYWRPNNDPDLENDVLWVNHITLEADAELMKESFPKRTAYEFFFDGNCKRHIMPLEQIAPHGIPDGDVDGDNRGIVGATRPSRDAKP
jgi:hypothetical protein